MPIKHPTPAYEDRNATMQQIMMSWLHEEYALEKYVALYCNTHTNKAGLYTKLLGGKTLQMKHFWYVGYQYYPPVRSEHHELPDLHKCNIGIHRGSFLLYRETLQMKHFWSVGYQYY